MTCADVGMPHGSNNSASDVRSRGLLTYIVMMGHSLSGSKACWLAGRAPWRVALEKHSCSRPLCDEIGIPLESYPEQGAGNWHSVRYTVHHGTGTGGR